MDFIDWTQAPYFCEECTKITTCDTHLIIERLDTIVEQLEVIATGRLL